MEAKPDSPKYAGLTRLLGGLIVAVITLLYLNALFFQIDEVSTRLPDIGPVWAAVAFLALLHGAYMFASGDVEIWNAATGTDGRASTSKFQLFLWTTVVIFGYTAIVAALLRGDPDQLLPEVPANVLLLLGISVGTGIGAKAITSNAVDTGKEVKTTARNELAGPLFRTDDGRPDIAKIQLLGFTFLAVAVFLLRVFDELGEIAAIPAGEKYMGTGLPDVDATLMLLMGVGSVAYIGGKLVSSSTPFITSRAPNAMLLGATGAKRKITLTGANFGSQATTGYVMLDGRQMPDAPEEWTDNKVIFSLPAKNPDGNPWKAGLVKIQVAAHGSISRELTMEVQSDGS